MVGLDFVVVPILLAPLWRADRLKIHLGLGHVLLPWYINVLGEEMVSKSDSV